MRAFVFASALVLAAISATTAMAERPADILARLRGTTSTNSGALGSDAPQQYQDMYRWVPPPPVFVFQPGRPVVILRPAPSPGCGVVGIACPMPGGITTTTTTTTTTTLPVAGVTTTTTTTTTSAGRVLAPAQPRLLRVTPPNP
jgi:hypothetical protein